MIRIVEVGPRDGLQNEPTPIPTELKIAFVRDLAGAGLKEIEATSFVSPKWVPQLADAAELWSKLSKGPRYSALVPNQKGLERALDVGVDRIALFTAASEAFTQKNINMSIAESFDVFREVAAVFRSARKEGWIRGYVSTAFECPYAGKIEPGRVADICKQLFAIGVDEVSIGDTIGVATPNEVNTLNKVLGKHFDKTKVAYHFHDTRGTAIANVSAALNDGFTTFDSSAGGLGGCPYAPGAGGNLATEDLVYFLERSGMATGVDLFRLASSSLPVLKHLGRAPTAKTQLAELSRSAACA